MGNSDENSATPLSTIFFKTVLVGAVLGIVISASQHLVPLTLGRAPDVTASLLVFVSGAGLGGALGAGSAALTLGFHGLATNAPHIFQAVAAGLGGGVGVAMLPFLVLGPPILVGNSFWPLSLFVLAGAAWAVVVTRPLRVSGRTSRTKSVR